MVTTAVILGVLNWCLNFIAILIFLSITIIGIKYRRDLRHIALVLTYNTCFAALLACIAVCVMITSNLSNGFLTYNLNFCYVCGLFYDIFQCSLYHSYYLQAFYRLCRVVFYKKRSLLSYQLFITLIVSQWLLTIVILLPPFFLNWYVHLSTEQYCLVPYTNLGAELYHIIILYVIPLVCIAITYLWITIFIRYTSRRSLTILATNQRQRNLRDLTVIKRIIVLISILVALRFPTIIFMIYAVTVGDLYPLTFGVVGLITAACMIIIGIMMIHITPQLRNNVYNYLMRRDNRVHTGQILPQRVTVPTVTGTGAAPAQQQKSSNVRNTNIPGLIHTPHSDTPTVV